MLPPSPTNGPVKLKAYMEMPPESISKFKMKCECEEVRSVM
jgi:hypothetical protein